MKQMILSLVKINIDANEKTRQVLGPKFDELSNLETPYGHFTKFVYHSFWAINLWLDRLTAGQEKFVSKLISDLRAKNDLFSEWKRTDQRWINYVKNLPKTTNFEQVIHYQSTSGRSFTTPLKDILVHMSHHSFYHRGQLALLLRLHGKTPLPPTDVIYSTRSVLD